MMCMGGLQFAMKGVNDASWTKIAFPLPCYKSIPTITLKQNMCCGTIASTLHTTISTIYELITLFGIPWRNPAMLSTVSPQNAYGQTSGALLTYALVTLLRATYLVIGV